MPASPSTRFVAVALWFGLAAGLCEVLWLALAVLTPRHPWPGLLHHNPHSLWLIPIVSGALVSCVGGGLALLMRVAPSLMPFRVALTGVAITASFAAIFHFRAGMGEQALALFACGIGFQLATFAHARPEGLLRLVRRTLPAALAVTGLLALVVIGRPLLAEWIAAARLPRPDASAPNVVLIVLDTVRASDVELDVEESRTPTLRSFAQTGVRFDRALATAPWTLPSIGSMMTGRLPRELFWRGETPLNFETPLPRDFPTMAEALRDRGYLTAGFVANTLYGSAAHGLNRGFLHYEDYPLGVESVLGSTALLNRVAGKVRTVLGNEQTIDRKDAGDVSRAFLGWLEHHERGPFFAFLNYFDAHDPYVPPAEFRLPGAVPPSSATINPSYRYPPAEIARLRRAYRANIAYIDHEVGVVLNGLRARGLDGRTLVVITSDHGEHFGEHGLMTHGNSLYRALLDVPLMVRLPGAVPEGLAVRQPVSLRDLAATVLDLVHVADPRFPGKSLARYWQGAEPMALPVPDQPLFSDVIIGKEPHRWAPSHWPVSRGGLRSVVADGYHYIRDGAGAEELYDFERDIQETSNLASTPTGRAVIARFRDVLQQSGGSLPSGTRLTTDKQEAIGGPAARR